MVKLTGQDVLAEYVQQKETYNCEVPPSPAIDQGFSAERKKSLMCAYAQA